MKITNSMTGKKEEFIPLNEGEVKMYACGITVYDLSHIGHARQAIVYSMITDYLRYKGYKVTYVRNYTDVDDKIIKRANEIGENAIDFSRKQIEETEIDMANLHVKNADINTKATEYIDHIIHFIEKLIEKDFAYVTDKGDVYYAVKKFHDYGKLSHRRVEELMNGVRIDLEEGKKEPEDFALWKSAKEGEIYWKSPWGNGRPGWHIECSVMALNTLGETIDIHGGGRDLLFPHHENEIAQSEALTGKPFARYWSHCGLIKINGEKMSKSLGNSLTIRDALKKYNYETIKYLMLEKHYASDIDLLDNDFKLAENHMYYFYTSLKGMEKYVLDNNGDKVGEILQDEIANSIVKKFTDAMDDDFNTAVALANLHNIFKYANNLMKSAKKDVKQIAANTLAKMLTDVKEVYQILGLFEQDTEEFTLEMKLKRLKELEITVDEIEELIVKRSAAKAEKDFATADSIRSKLDSAGIILSDNIDGTSWDIKSLYV